MTPQEQFDDLVRRKLDERSFPFEEAHWQAAQQAMKASRRGGRRGYWIAALALLLGTGMALSLLLPASEEAGTGMAEQTMGAYDTAQEVNDNASITAHTGSPSERSIDTQEDAHKTVEAIARVPQGSHGASDTDAANTVASINARTQPTAAHRDASRNKSQSDARTSVHGAAPGTPRDLSAAASQQERLVSGEPASGIVGASTSATHVAEGMTDDVASNTSHTDGTQELRVQETLSMSDATGGSIPGAEAAPRKEEVVMEGLTDNGSLRSTTAVAEESGTPKDAETTTIEQTTESTAPASADSSAEASIDVALLTPPRKPWELGLAAGPFISSTRYTGNGSASLNDATERMSSHMLGFELMHMGRHFGIGTGLYHGTHAERSRFDAVERTFTDVDRYWYLMPVDTSILLVTDTVLINGQPHYVGQQTPTTIHVITQGADTTTSTQTLRDARTIVNRTSYLEIPLLLDAHLVQGRWTFGLRGGPTLGLLTARRVSLPMDDGLGYADVEAVRRMVLGFHARGYIRYRWNAAWSVGIEPALRGQWMNSLEDGTTERRSGALGVLMSVSYRLR